MDVRVLTADDLDWPLGSQDSTPVYRCGAGEYKRAVKVDPYPAYMHDVALVQDLVAECVEKFPLRGARASLYLVAHDFIDRINGVTYEDSIYYRDDGTKWEDEIPCTCGCGQLTKHPGQAHTIVLAAKRIPIMPAMSRYLVAHEYGHAAFSQARRLLGYREHEERKLEEKYMALRGGGATSERYIGGKWHVSPGEIIANDFRVLVMWREVEFWPHNVPPPTPDSAIAEWWRHAASLAPPPAAPAAPATSSTYSTGFLAAVRGRADD